MLSKFSALTLLAVISNASAAYGTTFTDATYDQLAQKYQMPPIKSGTYKYGIDDSGLDRSKLVTYPPLTTAAYIKDGDTGVHWFSTLSLAKDAGFSDKDVYFGSTCNLLNGAALADRIMANSVLDLLNLTNNPALKTQVISSASGGLLFLEYTTIESGSTATVNAVAVAGPTRVPATKVTVADRTSNTSQYGTSYTVSYRAAFSISDLEKSGAIQNNKVTFQHGWKVSDACSFDLTQLP